MKYKTVKEISKSFKLSEDYIEKLAKSGVLDFKISNNEIIIPDYTYPRLRLLSEDKKYQKEILKSPKHFLYEYHPELKEYLQFHDIIDRFAWMIKLSFSPTHVLKNRRFRIDELFQYFLFELDFKPEVIKKKLIGTDCSKEKFKFHLLQGWYNEIASDFPFAQDFNIGSHLEYENEDFESQIFPSWKIIKSYYSIYSYFTAFVFTEDKNLKTLEHRKPSMYFNRHQLSKYSNIILKFPFNIYYKKKLSKSTFLDKFKREWKYKYAQCPRGDKSIFELEKDFRENLKQIFIKKANDNDIFTILDVMYEFRVWANYQGIDTITRLKNGGLLLFLERNLYVIKFFIAGITELVAISLLGEEEFTKLFEEFYLEYIKENDPLYERWYKIPQILRYRIYRKLKIVNKNPKSFFPPKKDELSLIQQE
jgi:hypothetical protein